ncbi:MAG: hypothetical protein WC307_07085, partial [Candidatus Nanoarchaeia archaeon]
TPEQLQQLKFGKGGINALPTAIKGVGGIVKSIGQGFINAGTKIGQFFSKTKEGFDKLTNSVKNFGRTNRVGYMSMLSIMFGAMAMASTLNGLTKTVLDATGVTKIFTGVLLSVFAPVLPQIIGFIVQLSNYFISLPNETKEMIAKFILLGGAIATVVAVGAQFALFLTGVASLGAIGIAAIVLLTAVVGTFVAEIIKGDEKAKSFVDNLFTNMPTIVANIFTNALIVINDFFTKMNNIVNIAFDYLKKVDWAAVWKSFFDFSSKVFSLAIDFLTNVWDNIKSWVATVDWSTLWTNFMEWSTGVAGKLATFLGNVITDMLVWAKNANWSEILGNIFSWGAGMLSILGEFVGRIAKELLDFKWIDVGVQIVTSLIEGFVNGWKSFWGSFANQLTGFSSIAEAGEYIKASQGTRQYGGAIHDSGAYMLHAGEYVSSGQNTGLSMGGGVTNNIVINASLSNGMDVDQLARRLEQYWGSGYGR